MNKLLFLIIAAGVVYLNYTNPTREEHEAFLLAQLKAAGQISTEEFERALKDVDFSNFMVCSATKTTLDGKMISLGYRKEIKLDSDQWIRDTMEKLKKRRGY